MGLLGDNVQMVLARIEEAGNEGMQFYSSKYYRDMDEDCRKTELLQTILNKCIKTLESQRIIKNIKAVKIRASSRSNYGQSIMIIQTPRSTLHL